MELQIPRCADKSLILKIPAMDLDDKQKAFWQEWIAALRSGKYDQITGRLKLEHSDGSCSYCCLGVAAELACAKHPQLTTEFRKLPETDGWALYSEDAAGCVWEFNLTYEISQLFNLGGTFGIAVEIEGTNEDQVLSQLNDIGVPFSQIADILEIAMNGGYDINKEQS